MKISFQWRRFVVPVICGLTMSECQGASIRIGHIVNHTEIYGPGLRSAIWVKGCTLACKGCWNKQYWPSTGGDLVTVEELNSKLNSIEGVEGITLLGGEPLQQAPGILQLIKLQKENNRTVMMYSGYEFAELNEIQKECVELSDIVILGRYVENKRNTSLRWRGSENQILFSPTGRYDVNDYHDGENEISVHIDANGELTITGYPDADTMLDLIEDLITQI